MGGLSGEEWSTFKRRGREILRRAKDPEGCLRRLRGKAGDFFKLVPAGAELKKERGWKSTTSAGAGISAPDVAMKKENQVSYGESERAVSTSFISNLSSVGDGSRFGLNSNVYCADLRAKFEEEGDYLRAGNQGLQYTVRFPPVPSTALLCFLCVRQETMASQDDAEMDLGAGVVGTAASSGVPAVGAGTSPAADVTVAEAVNGAATKRAVAPSSPAVEGAAAMALQGTPALEKGKPRWEARLDWLFLSHRMLP